MHPGCISQESMRYEVSEMLQPNQGEFTVRKAAFAGALQDLL